MSKDRYQGWLERVTQRCIDEKWNPEKLRTALKDKRADRVIIVAVFNDLMQDPGPKILGWPATLDAERLAQ